MKTKMMGAREDKDPRLPYQSPAIVYEGRIDIRAGSPLLTDEELLQDSFTGTN